MVRKVTTAISALLPALTSGTQALLIALIALGLGSSLGAQEIKRQGVEVGVSVSMHSGQSVVMPEVGYRFSPHFSLSVAGLLPSSQIKEEKHLLDQTTGAELRLGAQIEVLPRLSVGLSVVGGYGLVGYYDQIHRKEITIWGMDQPSELYKRRAASDFYKQRAWVGLRPTISYRIGSRWSAKASLGLLGYMWNDNQETNLQSDYDVPRWTGPKDRKGFSTARRYGAGFSLGLSYTF